jgi:hypothetical protein
MSEARHRAREAAQVALGVDGVVGADEHDGPDGTPEVEIVYQGSMVPPRLLDILRTRSLSLDPDATATRGHPTHTVVVAR